MAIAILLLAIIIIIGSASAFASSSRQLPLPSSSTGRHVPRIIQHHGGGGGGMEEEEDIVVVSSSVSSSARSSSSALDEKRAPQQQHARRRRHYQLTILIPAYNERNRIGSTLATYMNHLRQMPVPSRKQEHANYYSVSGSAAVLVVDDGSSDGTAEFVRGRSWIPSEQYSEESCETIAQPKNNYWRVDPNVSVIALSENCGKGAAIERGMMELTAATSIIDRGLLSLDDKKEDGSRPPFERMTTVSSLVLVADADGSGDISCLDGMLHRLEEMLLSNYSESSTAGRADHPRLLGDPQRPALVVGYRRNNLVPKSPLRALLSYGFRSMVSLLFVGCGGLGVRDTQCGFKLMTASAGKILYHELNLRRWSHDVEVIHRARRLNIPVGECGVVWVDKDGSKLIEKTFPDAIFVSLVMFGEIANMRLRYALGTWAVSTQKNGIDSRTHHRDRGL